MNPKTWMGLCLLATAVTVVWAIRPSHGDPPAEEKDATKSDDQVRPRLTVDEARRQARLLHTTYESTLIAVHRAYFEEGERQLVPARVLEEVFYWVDEETKGKTRWISVNTEAMNLDHNPKTDFEKQAAKVLSSGEEEFELVEDGVYHHAGAVTLVASCLRCHESTLVQKRRRKRVAGLVMSIPVKQD